MYTKRFTLTVFMVVIVVASATALAQRGPGPGVGRGGPGFRGGQGDPTFAADRDVFHFLLANHDKIRREVTEREDGVETLTESDDPGIVAKIQEHVAAMYKRVEEQQPIRLRDPLFAELFKHSKKIEMKFEKTDQGVRVTETSQDPYVARLIQEHAKVVSLFAKKGFEEAHQNHAVPGSETKGTAKGAEPVRACCAGNKAGCCFEGQKACCQDGQCPACPFSSTDE